MLAVSLRLKLLHATAGTGLLNGRSEELLGQFVREFPGSDKQRNGVCIATKLAPYPWRITSGIHSSETQTACRSGVLVLVLVSGLCAVNFAATMAFVSNVSHHCKILANTIPCIRTMARRIAPVACTKFPENQQKLLPKKCLYDSGLVEVL